MAMFPKPQRTLAPTIEGAQTLALQAVALILADEDLLPRFLAVSGCAGEQLRERITEPDFLGAVLDFVLEQDETVHLLAAAAGMAPEAVMQARRMLPGGQVAGNDW